LLDEPQEQTTFGESSAIYQPVLKARVRNYWKLGGVADDKKDKRDDFYEGS